MALMLRRNLRTLRRDFKAKRNRKRFYLGSIRVTCPELARASRQRVQKNQIVTTATCRPIKQMLKLIRDLKLQSIRKCLELQAVSRLTKA